MAEVFEIRHAGLFAGLGAGARGFNQARPDIGSAKARFRCIGGIDVDPAAIADFGRLAGVPGTVMDLFSLQQYRAFWGCNPPPGWREAGTADVHRAFGHERPHVVFLSAPCKGFSGLMSESKSKTAKYQALNELTLRGIWLTLEAYKDDPIEVLLFENVPRIATRGRHLLDQITALLRAYGYVVSETTHDCGELGGLAQSRRRFLLVARHAEKVPPFLYEPVKRPLQAVGTILGRMPLAGDVERGGPMHRVPSLQWKTWVRLAFVEAGSDWRSLNRLAVEEGVLRDYLIMPEVQMADTAGTYSVADPRHQGPAKHNNEYRIVPWAGATGAVTGAHGTGQCVQDPRAQGVFEGAGKYPVAPFDAPSRTVIARSDTGHGAYAVADPRPANQRRQGDAYLTNGHYGVVAWDANSGAVSAAAGHDNGKWSVADPRLPDARRNLVCVIRSMDNTWHRPFTTLELAALQSLVDPEEKLELDGLSDQAWRERIGNAVPPAAACAIGEEIGRTLLLAWTGQTFTLSSTPIWVRDVAIAMALPGEVRQ
ncbi:DNA cytosine methyltransferase [Stenotrophomonas maltophilia]|uniref:DNA cytosine methyltransferase n=1 Tax=Stenotrophomonas maltophilia group TaxID=995085 RepID=UPI00066BD28D|nr:MULTISPECIES: DNA cytosine methyltransferase [Stenotrophomonas]MBH1429898.1 DNA cytosine methyltransferase [Stenotrophomonas maltophilia]MDZ7475123.1 DNA cytosine methyltransferase [Stenotrophomonas pavanii]HEL4182583.1 DNA cytosine methyltransferase [Stenotrophomonas maltophilia]